ncbi:type I restriction-modification system subunit M/S [uncultured Subdoligranulum sp.]|uniref:type I restriction-modification system subunit M/S n=1 Tax=uncultured Subdoligranulum sp. TaxID=512298 RepID=UPI0025E66283|nr:type I restriction-modification system subunit M/S [uncultured Subdoligranulum sp.]
MTLKLSSFLASNSQFSEESGKRLLLYVSFVQCFCQQYHVSYQPDTQLEGLLPLLFRQVPGYAIKEAAVTFDSAMPWELLQGNSQLAVSLSHFQQELVRSCCATPAWLLAQLDDLFEADNILFDVSVTPPTLCTLIARLASLRPARQIVDLCCGTYSLGLRTWRELGSAPGISCLGEDINGYLCSFARLLLFLCGVYDFSIAERDITLPFTEPPGPHTPTIFTADFPFTGNRTRATSKDTPSSRIYADWLMIRALLGRMHPGDRAFVVATKGALVRKNECALRAELVKNDWLDAVIQLPPGLYPDHNLPLELVVFEKARPSSRSGRVFFADMSAFSIPGTRRAKKLSPSGIDQACRAFQSFVCELPFSAVVPKEAIEHAGWSLYPLTYLTQDNLPSRSLRLGDVASITRGLQLAKGSQVCSTPRYLLNIRDLQNGEILFETADQVEVGSVSLEEKYRIQEDDIILTSKGSALKIAIVPPNPPASYLGGNLTRIRVRNDRYSPYLLYEYLISERGQNALNLIQTGTTIRVLGSANLKELNIPDYASSSAVKIGAALKDAAIQHRQEKRKLDEAFARKRESLLSQLTTTKERET